MLDGRVAVIVEACAGAGLEIALSLAREGACLVLNDARDGAGGGQALGAAMEEGVRAVREGGGAAAATAVPAYAWDGAQLLMGKAMERFGQIDIVVGGTPAPPPDGRGRIDEIGPDAWEAILRTRLKAAFCCTRAALSHLRPRRRGRLLHLLSAAGLMGEAGGAHEGAVMTAIAGFSRNVAIEMERAGITSNCIALDDRNAGEQAPSAAGPLAAFLASDAADGISGQLFGVRGREIYLLTQPRIARGMHHARGWTAERLAGMVEPAMERSFTPLQGLRDRFAWDVLA